MGSSPSGPSEAEQFAQQEAQRRENERLQKEAQDRNAAVQAQQAQVSAIGKTNVANDSSNNELAKKKKAQQLSTGLNSGTLLS